jgi:hypothetical protein
VTKDLYCEECETNFGNDAAKWEFCPLCGGALQEALSTVELSKRVRDFQVAVDRLVGRIEALAIRVRELEEKIPGLISAKNLADRVAGIECALRVQAKLIDEELRPK